MNAYAGIGSRKTPKNVLDFMFEIGKELALLGYALRSGGAEGADSAFEKGADSVKGMKEIYLPWSRFNDNDSVLYNLPLFSKAIEIVSELHPAWNRCSPGAKKLLARNLFQILGKNLDSPSFIVIGWTNGGGGTGFAFKLAEKFDVPVLNLFEEKELDLQHILIKIKEYDFNNKQETKTNIK